MAGAGRQNTSARVIASPKPGILESNGRRGATAACKNWSYSMLGPPAGGTDRAGCTKWAEKSGPTGCGTNAGGVLRSSRSPSGTRRLLPSGILRANWSAHAQRLYVGPFAITSTPGRKMSRRDLLYGAGAAIAVVTGLAGQAPGRQGAASPSPASTTSPPSATTPATSYLDDRPTGSTPMTAGDSRAGHGTDKMAPGRALAVAPTLHLGLHPADEQMGLFHQLLDDAGYLGAPITVFAGPGLDQHRDLHPVHLAGATNSTTTLHPSGPHRPDRKRRGLERSPFARRSDPSGPSSQADIGHPAPARPPPDPRTAGVAGYRATRGGRLTRRPLDENTDVRRDAASQEMALAAPKSRLDRRHFTLAFLWIIAAFPHIIGDLRPRLEPALVRTLLA